MELRVGDPVRVNSGAIDKRGVIEQHYVNSNVFKVVFEDSEAVSYAGCYLTRDEYAIFVNTIIDGLRDFPDANRNGQIALALAAVFQREVSIGLTEHFIYLAEKMIEPKALGQRIIEAARRYFEAAERTLRANAETTLYARHVDRLKEARDLFTEWTILREHASTPLQIKGILTGITVAKSIADCEADLVKRVQAWMAQND